VRWLKHPIEAPVLNCLCLGTSQKCRLHDLKPHPSVLSEWVESLRLGSLDKTLVQINTYLSLLDEEQGRSGCERVFNELGVELLQGHVEDLKLLRVADHNIL